MSILNYLWIIPALPLLGSAINGLFGSRWPNKIINAFAVGSTGLSFLAALEAVREFTHLAPENIPWVKQYFTWIVAGDFRAGFDLQIDAPDLCHMYDPEYLDEYMKWLSLRIEAINQALKGVPEEKARLHVCWGSGNTPLCAYTWNRREPAGRMPPCRASLNESERLMRRCSTP